MLWHYHAPFAALVASQEAPPEPAGARAGLLELGDADAIKEAAAQHSARVSGGAAAGAPTPHALRERSTSIASQCVAPAAVLVKKTPKQTLAHDLAERGLRIIVIPGDGHCLFGAFAMSRCGAPRGLNEVV